MGRLRAHRDGILPVLALRRGVGHDDGAMERLPVLRRQLVQILHGEILQEFVGVKLLADGLDLQEGNVGSELDGYVGLKDAKVVE